MATGILHGKQCFSIALSYVKSLFLNSFQVSALQERLATQAQHAPFRFPSVRKCVNTEAPASQRQTQLMDIIAHGNC
jgi:hypothetical protein